MIAVATVVSSHPWEDMLWNIIRVTCRARLVARHATVIHLSEDPLVEVAIVDGDSPGLGPGPISRLTARGVRVVGLHPRHDTPARSRLIAAGVDPVLTDDVDPEVLLSILSRPRPAISLRNAIAVAGPGGAPGRTTFAAALCLAHTILGPAVGVDLDPVAPDLGEALAGAMGGSVTGMDLGPYDRPAVTSTISDDTTIVDVGEVPGTSPLLAGNDDLFVVIEGTGPGVEVARDWFGSWTGDVPRLVVNRTLQPGTILPLVRRHIGLEPIVVLPVVPDPVPYIMDLLIPLLLADAFE